MRYTLTTTYDDGVYSSTACPVGTTFHREGDLLVSDEVNPYTGRHWRFRYRDLSDPVFAEAWKEDSD